MIKLEIHGLKEIQQKLDGFRKDVKEKILQEAINKTIDKARSEVNRAISDEFAVKVSEVRSAVEVRRASGGRLEAVLTVFGSAKKRGRSLNMMHFVAAAYIRGAGTFKVRGGAVGVRKRDIKAIGSQLGFQIKRGGGLKTKAGAFIGNKGRTVFIRVPGTTMPSRSRYGGKKHAEQIVPVQVIGFSQMFSTRKIRARVMDKINDDLQVEVDRSVRLRLEGSALMAAWVNYDDILDQLLANGFELERVELAKRKRVKIAGNSQKGWYSLYEIQLDGGDTALVGSYGWWIGGETFVHKFDLRVDKKKMALSAEQREAVKARADADRKRDAAELARKQEAASQKASRWWRLLVDAGESGYLNRKGFQPGKLFGARVSKAGNLVVPMQDSTGKIHGLQVIYPTKGNRGRDKDFTPPGLAKKAHFFQIGLAQRGGVVLLCEGFATGASLHEATGLPVVVAFDAGNLLPVAQAIHKAHRRDVRILVCADDDYLTEGNPGKKAAEAAAIAVDGAWTWPIFPGERPTDTKGPTDFNDLHVHPDGGLQMVARQVQEAISAAGWRSATHARGGAASEGGGETADGRRKAMSVMPLDDIVARFVPLDDGTGKYVFDTWTNKIAQREQMITLLPAGVRGDDIKRHPLWVERGAYYLDQVGFDPTQEDRAVALNTWKGWPMVAKPGKCDRLLELIDYLCSAEANGREVRDWLLKWMAYPLQNPGAKMSSAVIMHGPQGTGKSTVFQCLAKIYGDYATVLNQRGLEDRFNADWVDSKLFILAEEVVTRAEMWHIKNELKELVTGEWIRVNPKNIAAYRQRNQVNIAYNSNENQPLPLDNDDRRHCVIYTPPALGEDYYDEVFIEQEQGGVAAFYDYLLKLDLTGFHPKKRPPMTESKRALIALSAPSEQRFVLEWVSGDLGLPVCPALSTDVYAAYLKWCKSRGESRPRPDNQFHGAVGRLAGWEKKRARVLAGLNMHASSTEPRVVLIPPINAIGKDHRLPSANYPDGTSETVWTTGCVVAFHDAMRDETSARRAFG